MSWQDTAAELRKKYGAEASGTESSGSWQDVAAGLMEKYSPEKYAGRVQQVSGWGDRYNDFLNRYSDYRKRRGYTQDFGGDFDSEITDLLQGYDEIKEFAGNHGLPNAQRYAGLLKDIRGEIASGREFMSQFQNEDAYNTYLEELAEGQKLSQMQEKYNWGTVQELETALEGMEKGEDRDYLSGLYDTLSTQERYGGKTDPAAYADLSRRYEDASRAYFELRNQLGVYSSGGAMAGSRLESDPELEALRKQVEAAKAEYDALGAQKDELDRREWFSEKSDYYEPVSDAARTATVAKTKEEAKARYDELVKKWGEVEYTRSWDDPERTAIYNEMVAARQAYNAFGNSTYRYINNVDGYRDRLMETDKKQHNAEPFRKYDFMTADEIATYNYLYASEGKKAAEDYLDYLSYYLDKQNMQRQAQEFSEFADKHPVLASISSIPTNLVSGAGLVGTAIQKGASAISGEYKPVNFNTAAMAPSVVTQAIRGTVAQKIIDATGTIQIDSEKNPVAAQLLNGKSWADVYQLGMSMADSAAVAGLSAIGIPGGTVLLGGSAGTQGMLDALERGATDGQAITMGILNGTFEALFEYVSLDKLLNGDVQKSALRQILEQAGVEASEEMCTTLANTFAADIPVMGDKSQLTQSMQEYRDAGLSEEEASRKAWADWGTDFLWDGIGGALSGGLMSGGKIAGTKIMDSILDTSYKAQYGGSARELVNDALALDPESKAAQKAQSTLEKGGELSGNQIRSVLQSINTHDKAAIQTAAEQRLKQLGETGDVSRLSAALAKQAAGETLNRSERRAIQFSQYGQRVSAELNAENIQSGDYSSAWAEQIGTSRLNIDAYNRLVQDSTPDQKGTVTGTQEEASAAAPAPGKASVQTEKTGYTVSEDGKTKRLSSGEEVRIDRIAEIGDSGMKLELSDGTLVDAGDIGYTSAGEAGLYEAVSGLGADAEISNLLVDAYKNNPGNVSIEDYTAGMLEAFNYGRYNYSAAGMAEDETIRKLTPQQRNTAYELGKQFGGQLSNTREANRRRAEAVQKARSAAEKAETAKKPSGQTDGTGKVHFDRKGRTFNETQETGLKTVELLSQLLGNDFYVFESYEKDGHRMYLDENGEERPAPNGFYDPKTGSVHVDLNAGVDGEGTMLFTLAHELTHFIRDWSQTKFDALSEAVLQMVYREKNIDVTERIREQITKAERNGRELTADEAHEEMIADSMETILRDGEVLRELMEQVRERDTTLWEKIVQWFRNLAEDIRRMVDAYKGKAPDSYEGRAVASMKGCLEVLEGYYADALSTAGENFRAADEAGTIVHNEEGARYSERDFSEQIDEVISGSFDRSNSVYMGETPKILSDVGLNGDLPLLTTANHIRKSMLEKNTRKHQHGLTEAQIKSLPEKISKPVMILDSLKRGSNSVVVVTDMTDVDGSPVVAIVMADGKGMYNNVEIATNFVTSFYGRDSFAKFIEKNVAANNLLYISKEKATDLSTESGTSWLEQLKNYDFDTIIRKTSAKVKEKYSSETVKLSTRDPLQEDAVKALKKENEALKEDVTRLKELVKLQRKVTHGTVLDPTSVESAARKLKKNTDAKGSTQELAERLNDLYRYIARGEELTWESVKEAAEPAVNWLWENRQSHMDPFAENVLDAMKGRKIMLNDAQREEALSAFGSIQEFRSRLKGTVRLSAVGTEGAMDLDAFWQEMSASYPGVFDRNTVDTDMPAALAEIAGRMQSMSYKDYERESPEVQDAMRQELLREVYETYWDVSSIRTAADVKQKEIDTLKLRHDRQMTDLRERHKESADTMKYRRRVEQKAKALSDALVKNSVKAHIPEALKGVVGEFLQSIQFSSKRLMEKGIPTKKDMSYTASLDRLRQVLQKQENLMNGIDSEDQLNGFYLDLPAGFAEAVQEHINKVTEAAGSLETATNQVYAMGAEDLKQLDYILTVISKSVSQMNHLLTNAHFQSAVEASQTSIRELNALGPDKSRGKVGNGVQKFLQWDNTTPYYAFKRMGMAAQSIFEGIQDGWDKLAFNTQAVIDFAEKSYSSKEVKSWSSDIRTVKLSNGKTIQISAAQIMSLYCLSKRRQAVLHLFGGGIRVGALDVGGKTVSDAQNYTLTAEDVGDLIGQLSQRQKEVADNLQRYMNTVGSKWGNEVSMARFGYLAFTEEHYFPIQTDANNRQTTSTDTQNANDLYRLLNLSMTKGLTENANNAIVVSSIFDVFADHMSDMAKYNALALPVLDAMKWYNFKAQSKSESGQIETSTVQKSLETAFGRNANSYITNFLKDINGNHDGGKGTDSLSRKMISNYKVAAVAGNLRVALLQPTAYVRATAVLDVNHLLRGLAVNPVKAAQEAEKYSGIAAWKSMGFYDTSIARGVRDQIKHDESVRGKIVEASMKGAEWGDRLTWGVLWNACKLEVKDNQNLSGDALMEATAKRFRDVVYRTQVVDSTMTRSQSMRDVKGLTGITTAFMAEPTLSYNMLLDAYSDYNGEVRRTGSKGKAWNKAGKAIFRTMVAYTVTNLAAALAEGLMDAWRDDDEYEKFYEKFLEHVGENFVEDMNPLTKLPIVKDAISYLQGYDNSRMDTEGVKNLVDALNIWAETIKLAFGWQSEPTSVTYNGNMTLYGKLYKTLKAVSQLSGIPFSNASREVASIWNNTLGVLTGSKLRTYDPGEKSNIKYAYIDGYLTEEEATRELLSKGLVEDSNEAYFQLKKWLTDESKYDALDAAIRGNGSIDSIVKELTSHGVEESDVLAHAKNAIGTWYKDGEISKQEATSMLKKYTDMDSDEVTAAVNKWRCKVDTGIAFEEIKSEFVSKHINAQRAADMYVKYGGYDKEDAEKLVAKWTAERDTGIAYEEIKSEFMGGKITESKAAEMYEKYGGYEPEEAQEKASVLSFVKNHPECDGISYSAIERYSEFCEPAGISANAFYLAYKDLNALESDKDENGDTVRNSLTKKRIAYIDSLNLTEAQKTALALCYMSESTVRRYKTW